MPDVILTPEQKALVRKARELITPPERRCSRFFAEDANGHGVDPLSPEAQRWCPMGAVRKAMGYYEPLLLGGPPVESGDWFVICRTVQERLRRVGYSHMAAFNHDKPHADVLAFLDEVSQ